MTDTIVVTNQDELLQALNEASGGETIYMEGGDYGDLALIDNSRLNLEFPATVTLTAADPFDPPAIGGLDLRGASNISFENVSFLYEFEEGDQIWTRPFKVTNSENITFEDCVFEGDLAEGLTEADNGYPSGFGLQVTNTTNITLENSEVSGFYKGVVIARSDGVTVSGNDVHGLRMDGLGFSQVTDVVIEDNHIHDFDRSLSSADHSDMIQFWTANGTAPSENITIRGNTLDIGQGEFTQSIFMRNDMVDKGLAGEEMFYQNVVIEDNVIVNGHAHGITLGESNGVSIANNTVLHADGASPDGTDAFVEIPRITVASGSTDVTIAQNATSDILGHEGQEDWTVQHNVLVQDQDPFAEGWYGDVFLASSLTQNEDGSHGFQAIPGGILEQLQAGATLTLAPPFNAVFDVTSEAYGDADVILDASVMVGQLPEGSTYVWDLGDGTQATGPIVEHSYATSGDYEVRLTVIQPNGVVDTKVNVVEVLSRDLVSLDESGLFTVSSLGESYTVDAAAPEEGGLGIQLGGGGVTASIDREALSPMFQSDEFEISFSIDADYNGATGEVFRLHGSYLVYVNRDGSVAARVWSDDGDITNLSSEGLIVNDGESHDVSLTLEDGVLSLSVNETVVQEETFDGLLGDKGRHDLTFGNRWSDDNFDGDLTAFDLSLEVDEQPQEEIVQDPPFSADSYIASVLVDEFIF